MAILVLFNKPYGVLSQFTDSDGRETLTSHIAIPNVYPAGRLDKDSEGLLLLTDDGKLQQRITNPNFKLNKHYWAQVEGEVNNATLHELRQGVALNDGVTLPAKVTPIEEPEGLWLRNPSIRFRKSIPTQWLDIALREGRNRQIRRMTAAVNHPTLRLIRHRIGPWDLEQLIPGQHQQIQIEDVNKLLFT